MITKLNPKEIFVFGSNLAGIHAGGAALQAKEFGAEDGVGEGLIGRCYAFPTLTESLTQVSDIELRASLIRLYRTANKYPYMTFLLTKVGTGIAGFSDDKMKRLFVNAPSNIKKPEGW